MVRHGDREGCVGDCSLWGRLGHGRVRRARAELKGDEEGFIEQSALDGAEILVVSLLGMTAGGVCKPDDGRRAGLCGTTEVVPFPNNPPLKSRPYQTPHTTEVVPSPRRWPARRTSTRLASQIRLVLTCNYLHGSISANPYRYCWVVL